MLQLVWSALNISLLVYFIVICFRAARLIRENSGVFASLLFGLGLLSFMGQSGKDKNAENQIVKQGFVDRDRLNPASVRSYDIALEKSPGSSVDLSILYEKDSTGKIVPIDAFSNRNGLVGGLEWVPDRIQVKPTADGDDFNYTVGGTAAWPIRRHDRTARTISTTRSGVPSAGNC
jgi:hypothetical protein